MTTHNIETKVSAPDGKVIHGLEAVTTTMVWNDWFWSHVRGRTAPARSSRHGPFKTEAEAIGDACRQIGGRISPEQVARGRQIQYENADEIPERLKSK